jgi:hypothetical protein
VLTQCRRTGRGACAIAKECIRRVLRNLFGCGLLGLAATKEVLTTGELYEVDGPGRTMKAVFSAGGLLWSNTLHPGIVEGST